MTGPPNAQGPPTRGRGDPLGCQLLAGVDVLEINQNRPTPQANLLCNPATARLVRLQYLARRLHGLGEKPLFHFLDEVERGEPLRAHLERYAALPADFIKITGDRFPPSLHVIDGSAR